MRQQPSLPGILERSFRERQRAIDRYITRYRDMYSGMAEYISPDTGNWKQVWGRVTFAILSANAPFERAVSALGYANRHRGRVDDGLVRYGMVPAKVDYINALPTDRGILALTRQPDESWHNHRMRLRQTVKGLGLCKASFASALLDPVHADVACVDTHMQQVYLGAYRVP